MGIQDKVVGRLKQAAGDLTGDQQLRNEGVREERKAEAIRELREAEQRVGLLRDEIAQLEYGSSDERASLHGTADQTTPENSEQDGQTGVRLPGDAASSRVRGERR